MQTISNYHDHHFSHQISSAASPQDIEQFKAEIEKRQLKDLQLPEELAAAKRVEKADAPRPPADSWNWPHSAIGTARLSMDTHRSLSRSY